MNFVEHTTGLVGGPGLYRMPAAIYHADPAPEPSLSSSVACEIIANTPLHGKQMHPRLRTGVGGRDITPDDDATPAMNMGSVVHELLLGEGGGYAPIPFKDFRTKDARAARDDAVAAGKTPIIEGKLKDAQRMADRVRARLKLIPGAEAMFEAGGSEAVLVWKDELGIFGRCMIDRWGPTPEDVWDIKTTTSGLSDRAISARVADGIDLKAAWYRRGVERLLPELQGKLRYRLIWVEQAEPFEVRIKTLPQEAWAVGREKAVAAALWFRHGLRTGDWPGYPSEITEAEYPAWATPQWEARLQYDSSMRPIARDLLLALSHQAPILEAAE